MLEDAKKRMAEDVICNLKKRNMEGIYCRDKKETVETILSLIEPGAHLLRDRHYSAARHRSGSWEFWMNWRNPGMRCGITR